MTTLVSRPAEDRLRTTLLVDAVVVGLSGVLLATTPSSWYGDLPGWLVRVAGIALAVAAADVGLASRWRGRRLRIAATVTAELAFLWTLGVLLAADLGHVRGDGLEVLALSGVATLVFGTLEVSLVRALR